MKVPTKAQFKALLESEIQMWGGKVEELPENSLLREQAIGRMEQCIWLLKVFEGQEEIPN